MHTAKGMNVLICYDTHTSGIGRKGNELDPVACTHETDSAMPARVSRHTCMPGRILRPLVNIDSLTNAEPGCIGIMICTLCQIELALNKASTTGGIYYPACMYHKFLFALT